MLNLKAGQMSELTVIARDQYGNPAEIEAPLWELSDETVCRIDQETPPGPDGAIHATLHSTGKMGTCLVTFTGDGAIGETVRPVVGTLDVVVAAGDAITVEIQAGTPTDPATP